jgi:hypothetical protein
MQNAFMKSKSRSACDAEDIPLNAHPPISLDLFMRQSGLSPTTCWRYRKRSWLRTVIIANRHYVTREAIAEFNRLAAEGQFAGTLSNPSANAKAKSAAELGNKRHGHKSAPSKGRVSAKLNGNEQ